MKTTTTLLLISLAASVDALAFSADCETFLAAAEKSAAQPARHSIAELGAGLLAESITIDGTSYIKADRGWNRIGIDMLAKERELNAQMRSGELVLEACEVLGPQTVDGVVSTAIRYRVAIPGADPATATVHVRGDGLVHAVSTGDGTWVRYRYEDVVAPAL
jgi:hypothetical protein